MCLLFYYLNPSPKINEYKLIMISSRDEVYSRPTAKAHIWNASPKIVSGRDLTPGKEGGTWLGASETGKICVLLNMLQSKDQLMSSKDLEARGCLVINYLNSDLSAEEYVQSLKDSKKLYDQFSLVMIQPDNSNRFKAVVYNNVADSLTELGFGIEGIGNCFMDKKFKKVLAGQERLATVVGKWGTKDKERDLIEAAFEMMKDKAKCHDEILRLQGRGQDEAYLEALSSCWVSIPSANYGTRTLTVVLVDYNNDLHYEERTMANPSPNCDDWDVSTFIFPIKAP